MIRQLENYICEYIWIGGRGEIRSKTKVIKTSDLKNSNYPEWNYDGSSTEQASSDGNTEVILKPVAQYIDPLRKIDNACCMLILCDTYDNDGRPLPTNFRENASRIFSSKLDEEPWFGIEQEYFLVFHEKDDYAETKFFHYCGNVGDKLERKIAETHLKSCLEAGLQISGINSEVSPNQWEFQIGPAVGIDAGDQLIIARFLLERIAEWHNASVNYYPKPFSHINGSGCHINFSTKDMRELNGYEIIKSCMPKLERRHKEHIEAYGKDNHLRLTGIHETSSMEKFSFGVGTRNTSVRIPNQTDKDGSGYFEDRRPAANIDPYRATSILFETCCLIE